MLLSHTMKIQGNDVHNDVNNYYFNEINERNSDDDGIKIENLYRNNKKNDNLLLIRRIYIRIMYKSL